MKKIENWDSIQETSQFAQLVPGPQICKITAVEDLADKEYYKIYFDIVGTTGMKPETIARVKSIYPEINELVGEFARQETAFGTWPRVGYDIRSYKDTAVRFFKAFITAVEKSNKGYTWNWDEKSLVGKLIIVNFGEEEYEKDGVTAVSIKAREFRSIEAFLNGEVKLLPIKKVHPSATVAPTATAGDSNDPKDPNYRPW